MNSPGITPSVSVASGNSSVSFAEQFENDYNSNRDQDRDKSPEKSEHSEKSERSEKFEQITTSNTQSLSTSQSQSQSQSPSPLVTINKSKSNGNNKDKNNNNNKNKNRSKRKSKSTSSIGMSRQRSLKYKKISSDHCIIKFQIECMTSPHQYVCLIGNCDQLGNWSAENAISMKPAKSHIHSISANGMTANDGSDTNTDDEDGDALSSNTNINVNSHNNDHKENFNGDDTVQSMTKWYVETELPKGINIEYKYLVRKHGSLAFWEVLPKNRSLYVDQASIVDDGVFGKKQNNDIKRITSKSSNLASMGTPKNRNKGYVSPSLARRTMQNGNGNGNENEMMKSKTSSNSNSNSKFKQKLGSVDLDIAHSFEDSISPSPSPDPQLQPQPRRGASAQQNGQIKFRDSETETRKGSDNTATAQSTSVTTVVEVTGNEVDLTKIVENENENENGNDEGMSFTQTGWLVNDCQLHLRLGHVTIQDRKPVLKLRNNMNVDRIVIRCGYTRKNKYHGLHINVNLPLNDPLMVFKFQANKKQIELSLFKFFFVVVFWFLFLIFCARSLLMLLSKYLCSKLQFELNHRSKLSLVMLCSVYAFKGSLTQPHVFKLITICFTGRCVHWNLNFILSMVDQYHVHLFYHHK